MRASMRVRARVSVSTDSTIVRAKIGRLATTQTRAIISVELGNASIVFGACVGRCVLYGRKRQPRIFVSCNCQRCELGCAHEVMSCGRNCPSDWTTAFLLRESFLSVSLSFSLHRLFVLSHMRPDARSDSSSRSTILSCHMQVLMLVLAETPLPANQQSHVEGVDRCSSLVGCCQSLRDWQARCSEMSRIFADNKIMRCLPTRDPYGHAHRNLSSSGDKSRRSSSFFKSRRPTLFEIGASFALPYNNPI
jgi:hypothetical protein